MQPINSASISGKGTSPLGPIEGTWVVGWYLDGPDKQMPMMIGTIGSSSLPKTYAQTQERPVITNPAEEEIKKHIEESPNTPVPIRKPVAGWELGKTSEKYESGGKGPGVINDYNNKSAGDYGGASYGTYQFASYLPPIMPSGKSRPSATNSPLVRYIKDSRFKNKLLGIKPATKEFDDMWKSLAKEHPEEFKEDQHNFIKKNYYDVLLSNLKRSGIDLSGYGPAVQDLIWSTAVQLGPGKTEVFVTPLKGKSNLSEADIVSLVSDYKISKVPTLFASSNAGIQKGVSSRYVGEKQTLLTMIT
jgi:type VI secretion system secreted protein VgrG